LAVNVESKKTYLGQPGTKSLVNQCGTRLVCVRYRYDAVQAKRFKTIKIIVEETAWQPPVRPFQDSDRVGIRLDLDEVQWRQRGNAAGGKRNAARKLWELEYGKVRKLRLTSRSQTLNVSANGNQADIEPLKKSFRWRKAKSFHWRKVVSAIGNLFP
jgi:hypothetical protein